ncbi:alkaline phosphatase PafA [Mesohalobacter halotolerans]|uniref:Alkaline phosphatase family protein n=1 Tax=Mesohalobacter halotolerans TaxID=1883405 RepID=A0A4U5TQ05_9FLAO|nr:alkaline phosphatase PafA [Mesohalobacter halotolerans]TKS56249.1 alkaline phosphatase family protein [Mesohalobacter halotolerans]
MIKPLSLLLIIFISSFLNAQTSPENPRLVIGIVVDQMRYEYLHRFENHYSDNGFKRLIEDGFFAKNTHFSYIPTYTGPGHASVYTGTTPANHGIISNNWYDKFKNQSVYCVQDNKVNAVGVDGKTGQMSPHRMLTTSIADQNRLHTQFRGKTFGISIKDRGAILPAGHTANAAYWFVGGDEGKFITSDFYLDELPKWVTKFNRKTKQYFKTWETLYPIEEYRESGDDLNDYEFGFKGQSTATFPYNLKKLKSENGNYDILKPTPFANTMLTDFAVTLIENEELGQDGNADFLTISYSSTDYAGHNFGVNAKELQDMYIRLDQNIADLLNFLDQNIGKDNYTIFLTSDHGAVHVPNYLKDKNIPAGYFNTDKLKKAIMDFVEVQFESSKLIEGFSSQNIFFDYAELEKLDVEADDLQEALYYYLLQYDKIDRVYTRDMIENSNSSTAFSRHIANGFHPKRSGDVIYVLEPSVISYPPKGSTHGSYMTYDTQAPLIFYGQGINQGQSYKAYFIKDIAPTLAALLDIAQPNGTTGKVIGEALKN